MNHVEVKATKRDELGKGPSRRWRMQDKLPAVVYTSQKDAFPIIVCPREMTKIMRGPLRRNTVITLQIEGDKARSVMIKERQIHPVRRNLVHIDFVEVDMKKPVLASVPLRLSGKSESVTMGGKLDQILQKMKISCLPNAIPEFIDINITNLPFGSTHCENIPLPEGLKLAEKPRVVVLTIKKPRGAAKEDEAAAKDAAPAKKK
jgi:large subunit ribosomal protein L25